MDLECRICRTTGLIDIVDLGEQVITSRFPKYGDFSIPKTPIVLSLCQECSLVQLKHTTPSVELYEHESGYGYRSGINNTMKDHLREYNAEIQSKVSLQDGDVVMDIGSNDATMLRYYRPELKRIGVDPTGKQFREYYGSDIDLLPTYFSLDAIEQVYGTGFRCKVISSISMFYDLPDPVQFARDIYDLLSNDGIWTCEQSYLLSMLETNSIDTICHEHLEYYSLTAIKRIADIVGFRIFDIKFNACNGGSFRIYFGKNAHDESNILYTTLEREHMLGVNSPEFYLDFIRKCDMEVNRLREFVIENSREVYIYGASTKGNCLLQYANLDSTHIPFAIERNPNKVGKMTSTGIEIISEETMRYLDPPPKFLLVLPWHFKREIIERERAFLEGGGKLVFPLPKFEVYGL